MGGFYQLHAIYFLFFFLDSTLSVDGLLKV